MIRGFKYKETEKIFRTEGSKRFPSLGEIALRKLLLLEGAGRVEDLRVPPGNKLEKLYSNTFAIYRVQTNVETVADIELATAMSDPLLFRSRR
jgi:toxin HigB-1